MSSLTQGRETTLEEMLDLREERAVLSEIVPKNA